MRIARSGAFATAAIFASCAAGLAQDGGSRAAVPQDAGAELILGSPVVETSRDVAEATAVPVDEQAAVLSADDPEAADDGTGVAPILRSFAVAPAEHGDGLDPETVRPEAAFLLDGISAALLRGPDPATPNR